MAFPKKAIQRGVTHPHQSLGLGLLLFTLQPSAKSRHHPGDEREALRAAARRRSAVLAKQAFGGDVQKSVHVLRELQIRVRAADLEHAAAASLERPPYGHPDRLHEEMIAQNAGEDALGLVHPPAGLTQVAKPVRRLSPADCEVDVVLEHQALR